MQEPKNSDIWELADMALGAVAIQQPKSSQLYEEQEFLNACLIKILDYRLETLSDDAGWDFVAQAGGSRLSWGAIFKLYIILV